MPIYRTFGWILIILLLGFGCKAPEITSSADKQQEQGNTPVNPMIMTVIFQITAMDSTETPGLELEGVITSKGILKENPSKPTQIHNNGLYIHILDKEKTILREQFITNPLKKRYETIDDDGLLKSHDLELDSATFSIRIQENPRVHSLQVFVVEKSGLILIKHLEL